MVSENIKDENGDLIDTELPVSVSIIEETGDIYFNGSKVIVNLEAPMLFKDQVSIIYIDSPLFLSISEEELK